MLAECRQSQWRVRSGREWSLAGEAVAYANTRGYVVGRIAHEGDGFVEQRFADFAVDLWAAFTC
jgi:hypothetical protein